MRIRSVCQWMAGACASSFLFRRGRTLWEANSKHFNYLLSKWEKLSCGTYLILQDYAAGIFPPRFEDQAQAYENEINYNASLPGVALAEIQKGHAIKPFWAAAACAKYLEGFARLYGFLERHGIKPGQRLLELGCGPGWMAEWYSIAGYRVVGTTISHYDVSLAENKIAALRAKELNPDLSFVACPMESVDRIEGFRGSFDAVYVFEALHHAYDWRKAIEAAAAALKAGGWLLLANEPNLLHTFISYRVARLSRTHEIGFSKRELLQQLKASGFTEIKVEQPKINNWVTPFWILARKGSVKELTASSPVNALILP